MVAPINTTTRLMRFRRVLKSAFGVIAKTATFLSIALIGGSVSSWYAVEGGTRFNTERQGPWVKWSNAGRLGADPYSKVRFNRREVLVFNADLAKRYEASRDSDGRVLHSSCNYVLEGARLSNSWWSLAVFDSKGELIPNPANRYGFNAATVGYKIDGGFTIHLSREAKPYNWLPTARGGKLVLILEVQQRLGSISIETDASEVMLPEIKRTSC